MPKPKQAKNGVWTITVSHNYERRNLTLGRIDASDAKLFAANVASLKDSQDNDRIPSASVKLWVQGLSDKHKSKLAELGLLKRIDKPETVGQLIKKFLEHYNELPPSEVSDSTKKTFRSSMRNRVTPRLKRSRIKTIEPEHLVDMPNAKPVFTAEAKKILSTFEVWQRNHYSSSTWSKDNKRLRQVGKWAVESGYCHHNPFSPLPVPGELNEEHNVDVPADTILDIMEQCLDPDTRLVFALGRFAGLRTPKEVRTIKPEHVDFEKRTLKILDCKKKKYRKMPLFDLVYDELILHRSQVKWGRYIMSQRFLRSSDANNWNLMTEAIDRTEHGRWVDLRQNLRSSCVNYLLDAGFEERQVCAWLGHSQKTSRKHYQTQTDRQLKAAVEKLRELA